MSFEDRIKKVRAESYEVKSRIEQVQRKRSQLRERFSEQIRDWQIAMMRHSILIAEIKKNNLAANTCVSGREAVGGYLIQ